MVITPIMATLDWSKEFEIMCDASDYAVKPGYIQIFSKNGKTINYRYDTGYRPENFLDLG